MTTYVVATTEAPEIVCPAWCTVAKEEHLADLENWDGYVVHWSTDRELCPSFVVRLAATQTPAGVDCPTEGITVHFYDSTEAVSLEDAAALATGLAALAKEGRA